MPLHLSRPLAPLHRAVQPAAVARAAQAVRTRALAGLQRTPAQS